MLLVLGRTVCLAQFGRLYTPDDLLSSSLVNDIKQDKKGFVWIATQDGLNCYDSNHMTVFHKGDESGLVSNDVHKRQGSEYASGMHKGKADSTDDSTEDAEAE